MRGGRTRTAGAAGLALAATLAAGCVPSAPRAGALGRTVEAHHSLEEVGEMAFAGAEAAEEKGRWKEAFDGYARAEWAFEYHRRLTGREPALLGEARAACDRMAARLR